MERYLYLNILEILQSYDLIQQLPKDKTQVCFIESRSICNCYFVVDIYRSDRRGNITPPPLALNEFALPHYLINIALLARLSVAYSSDRIASTLEIRRVRHPCFSCQARGFLPRPLPWEHHVFILSKRPKISCITLPSIIHREFENKLAATRYMLCFIVIL